MGSSLSDRAPPGRRAVIVGSARTPFHRAFTALVDVDAIGLGAAACGGLLDRVGLNPDQVDSVIWGGVILPSAAPNVGRELVLDLRLPPRIEAMTVSRACASGLQAITLAAAAIERGEADVVIAGGGDSTSHAAVQMGPRFGRALAPVALGKKMGLSDWAQVVAQLAPISEVLPRRPEVAERSTGERMGEAAERMARRHGVGRDEQDAFALRSHQRAAAAEAAGLFAAERAPVRTPHGDVEADGLVRTDTSLERLGRLKPVFDKAGGTLTAGNSTPLTDGAAAVLLMREDRARALGLRPLAALRSWAYVGVDPADQLLIGPAIAMPLALERAGLQLSDIDLVDIHEAFAAQVLCVLRALASDGWARERLGRDRAVGEVDPARLNVLGGSLAFGHPFAATGARMVGTMAHELARRGHGTALLGICAAGGLGAAAVLEAVDGAGVARA
jgi:acetyl-CoA acyltransferase